MMKYVNLGALLLASIVGGVSGCAFNADGESWNYDGSRPVKLSQTEQFLPVQERDETGQLLAYQPAPNPYTDLNGRIDKETVTAYIDARRAFKAQKYQFADKLLAELVAHESKLSGPWVMRGDIAMAREDLGQAVEYYVTALELNSINFNAWLRLAKAQRMRGHFNHAQNTYAKALDLWPDGPELHLNLGVLYDLYLNMPLKAQAHMEAYQLLSSGNNRDVAAWLEEIRQRTGVAKTLKITGPEGEAKSISKQPAPKDSSSETTEADIGQPQELAASKPAEE